MAPDEQMDVPNIREWERGRYEDRELARKLVTDVEQNFKADLAAMEARLLTHINGHKESHRELDASLRDQAKMVDSIQSVLDQQRGARNLITFIGFTAILNVALLLLHVWQLAQVQ